MFYPLRIILNIDQYRVNEYTTQALPKMIAFLKKEHPVSNLTITINPSFEMPWNSDDVNWEWKLTVFSSQGFNKQEEIERNLNEALAELDARMWVKYAVSD